MASATAASFISSRDNNEDHKEDDDDEDEESNDVFSLSSLGSDETMPINNLRVNLRIMAQTSISMKPKFFTEVFCNDNYIQGNNMGSTTDLFKIHEVKMKDFIDVVKQIMSKKRLFPTFPKDANMDRIYFRSSPPITLQKNDIQTDDVVGLTEEDFNLSSILKNHAFEIKNGDNNSSIEDTSKFNTCKVISSVEV